MIYTKTGDKGTTSLIGGTRVSKADLRVEAYGTVDELNAQVGLLAEMVRTLSPGTFAFLKGIQNNLFVVQTLLAAENPEQFAQLPADATEGLERQIDAINAQLPQLRSFVIPGGSMSGAQAHVARTVCRRAERCIVRLELQEKYAETQRYINRLSDFLFVLSRHLVLMEGQDESLYIM